MQLLIATATVCVRYATQAIGDVAVPEYALHGNPLARTAGNCILMDDALLRACSRQIF
jgi:hypothetical protein